MEMRYETAKRALVVSLSHDLDHHGAASLREKIDYEFRRRRARNIIFDLSALKFMDSSGIGLIMGRYRLSVAAGGKVFLSGVSPQLDRLISISGIYKIVGWAKSISEALQCL